MNLTIFKVKLGIRLKNIFLFFRWSVLYIYSCQASGCVTNPLSKNNDSQMPDIVKTKSCLRYNRKDCHFGPSPIVRNNNFDHICTLDGSVLV